MNKVELEKIKQLFLLYPEIKLVYFFGSRANKNAGPMSDYDFALYLHGIHNPRDIFLLKAELQAKLTLILKTDNIDVVSLNNTQNPALGYNIITTGKLIYEIKPYKIIAEPKILNKYFDNKLSLEKNYLEPV